MEEIKEYERRLRERKLKQEQRRKEVLKQRIILGQLQEFWQFCW